MSRGTTLFDAGVPAQDLVVCPRRAQVLVARESSQLASAALPWPRARVPRPWLGLSEAEQACRDRSFSLGGPRSTDTIYTLSGGLL